MDNRHVTNTWQRLPSGYDVEIRHGIPVRVSDNGRKLTAPGSAIPDEVAALCKLQVRLGQWETGEDPDEHEARLYVQRTQLDEVLRRLALASAAMFFDRFHKAVDNRDVDWDRLEFTSDFSTALEHCGLQRAEVDADDFRAAYVETMHQESRRLEQAAEVPLVEPE